MSSREYYAAKRAETERFRVALQAVVTASRERKQAELMRAGCLSDEWLEAEQARSLAEAREIR